MKYINIHFVICISYCDVYKPYIVKCLDSVKNNNYTNYEIIFVNDGATDITFLNNHSLYNTHKISVISSGYNYGPGFSKWKFIEYLQNNNFNINDVAIIIDGDDTITSDALEIINKCYIDNTCWCSFGSAIGNFCLKSKNEAIKSSASSRGGAAVVLDPGP